ncbi:hypothetical protein K0028_10935 [Curtobacterium flaccumfaciens pv. flaccumfaciens]|uniref:hypothetical protein n=1 Tax=Curtobacterium flaccumfaciens TaxID=2035 RepID=UPI0021B0D87C|nr:hypothetical protein [Curtobacterium flaccumfaciens]QYI96222.1 hypothetical protein K0028_10935 [Curtobacterium flaccumfaciens pv. flaccumfaciens]
MNTNHAMKYAPSGSASADANDSIESSTMILAFVDPDTGSPYRAVITLETDTYSRAVVARSVRRLRP